MHVWGKMRESHAKYVKLYRSESGEIKGNFKKISKFSSSYCRYSLVDCLHSRNKTLAKVVGNYRREDVSVTWSCPVSVESLSLLQINRHGSFLVCHYILYHAHSKRNRKTEDSFSRNTTSENFSGCGWTHQTYEVFLTITHI